MFTLKKSTKAATITKHGRTIMLALTAVFTGLVIAGAFIKIPIPVIPFTLQTFFVQLTASMMGPVWGGIVIALYLFMGLIGIPVFTKGGGFMYVLQPTFGYLIGFLLGTIAEGLILKCFKKKNYWTYLIGNLANLLIAYACGMIYFYFLRTFYAGESVSAYTIFVSLFLVFLPGDLTFTLIASAISPKLKPILDKFVYQTATDEDIKKYEEENAIKLEDAENQPKQIDVTLENSSNESDVKVADDNCNNMDESQNKNLDGNNDKNTTES